MEIERLQKILARAGYGSRRACEQMIEQGRVAVDGHVAGLGDKADPATQRITLDGVPIQPPKSFTYVMLNKPRGVISTTSDPERRRTVLDLVDLPQRLYPVGRLDANSEGLILLTDDGKLTQHLTHPRYEHSRVYRVLVDGEPDAAATERWQRGVTLDGDMVRFDSVEIDTQSHGKTWLRVTVHEGRKHLVRRVVATLGYTVLRLIRVKMGPLQLGDLSTGRWRYLNSTEINTLRKQVGIAETSSARPNQRARGKGRIPSRRRGSSSRKQRERR